MLFDLSIGKLLVLAVIAVVIFGPNQLPKMAAQAGRALRELRRLADGARDDLREGLGPEFSDFDIADLHPRNFVRKHLLDDVRRHDRLRAAGHGDRDRASAGAGRKPALRPRGDLRIWSLDRGQAERAAGQPAAPAGQPIGDAGELPGGG